MNFDGVFMRAVPACLVVLGVTLGGCVQSIDGSRDTVVFPWWVAPANVTIELRMSDHFVPYGGDLTTTVVVTNHGPGAVEYPWSCGGAPFLWFEVMNGSRVIDGEDLVACTVPAKSPLRVLAPGASAEHTRRFEGRWFGAVPENLAPGGEYRVVGRFGYWPVLTYDPNVAATVREANSTFVWEGWNATKHTPQFRFWLDSNETEFFPGTSVAIVAHLQNTWDKAILVNTACDNPWVVFKLHRGIVQLGAMESGLRCLARTPVVVEPGAFLEHSFSWNGTILSDGFVNGEPRPQYPALPGGNYTVEGTITYWDGPLKLKTYSGNATTGVRFLAKELGEQD